MIRTYITYELAIIYTGGPKPPELTWLFDNYKHLQDFRWFGVPPNKIEIHLLNSEAELLYKLKFKHDTYKLS